MAGTAYVWQQGKKTDTYDNGNERRIRDEIDEAVRQINTARGVGKQLLISNALMQAAAEDATRGMSAAMLEEYGPQDYADDHLWDGEEVSAVYAQGSPQVLELCDAIVKDEDASKVIDGEAAFIGVGLAGSQYNLRIAVYLGKGDAQATRKQKQDQALTEIALRDGIMFGDEAAGDREIQVWSS